MGKAVNLMDALRKRLGTDKTVPKVSKKPVLCERAQGRKDIGPVKARAEKAGKRKSG